MKRYVAVPGILLLTIVSGCFYELRDEFAECKIGYANRWAARSAWQNAQGACTGISCPHSFKEGFNAGYSAVANGGNGCPPAVPIYSCHNHMWMDRCCETDKMSAWYDGYEVGAMAAKGDGMQDANRFITRIPQATPVDYSGAHHVNSAAGPSETDDTTDDAPAGAVIPPAPLTEPGEPAGPQTRRLLREILQ